MIKLFPATAEDFEIGSELFISDPLEVYETKKRSLNGWSIEVKLPIKYAEYIAQDKIIVLKTKSKLNPQAFRINNIEKDPYYLRFEARHVMFDSERYFILDARPTNLNGQNALDWINVRTDQISPFTFYSDVTDVNTSYFIRKTLLEVMSEIEELWGGTFEADNFNISFMTNVGNDNGVRVAYAQNLENIEVIEDWSGVCTRIYPIGKDGITLDSDYIDSDVQYDKKYVKLVKFESNLDDELASLEDYIEELTTNATEFLNLNKFPMIQYSVSSNVNQDLEIGDIVRVLHPLVELETNVQEYEYNVLTKRVENIVFGNYTKSVEKAFADIKESIDQNNQILLEQTNTITNLNKLGYVYIDENEILILDKLPKEDAENVWRFGLGGIGFSSNGYSGPFEVAIFQDGKINANFITAGTMAINRIQGLSQKLLDYDAAILLNGTNIQFAITKLGDIDANGVKKVLNTLLQLDENGILLSKTGQDMKIKLGYLTDTVVGLEVKRDEVVEMSVTNVGVLARYVKVIERQDTGNNLRTEDFTSARGIGTGFFFNGGS
jgi:phage minor structural protein